jgi:hypothetical protein
MGNPFDRTLWAPQLAVSQPERYWARPIRGQTTR